MSLALTSIAPPRTQGMPREGPATLVASTTWRRRPGRLANQRPRMRSVAPKVSRRGGTLGLLPAGRGNDFAVKITYLDRANAEWQLECFTGDGKTVTRNVTCGVTGTVKTVTYILKDAYFPGVGYTGLDMQIRALKGDAVIRLVRLIKLDSNSVTLQEKSSR